MVSALVLQIGAGHHQRHVRVRHVPGAPEQAMGNGLQTDCTAAGADLDPVVMLPGLRGVIVVLQGTLLSVGCPTACMRAMGAPSERGSNAANVSPAASGSRHRDSG